MSRVEEMAEAWASENAEAIKHCHFSPADMYAKGYAQALADAARECEERYGSLREYNGVGVRMAERIRALAGDAPKK